MFPNPASLGAVSDMHMQLTLYLRKTPVPGVGPHAVIGNRDVVDSRKRLVEQSGLLITLERVSGAEPAKTK